MSGIVEERTLYEFIGEHVRDARLSAGLTQAELAGRIQMSRTSLTNLESGRQQVPLTVLYDLAESLGVSAKSLLPDTLQRPMPLSPNEHNDGSVDAWVSHLKSEPRRRRSA